MQKFSDPNSRGFIKIAVVVIAGLILLKYVYDIDVLAKVYGFVMETWGKYGDSVIKIWDWIKAKLA